MCGTTTANKPVRPWNLEPRNSNYQTNRHRHTYTIRSLRLAGGQQLNWATALTHYLPYTYSNIIMNPTMYIVLRVEVLAEEEQHTPCAARALSGGPSLFLPPSPEWGRGLEGTHLDEYK